jgi:glycerol-3-phosphate dehydrogenase (NAD(P)+)
LGAGAWGSALAITLTRNQQYVYLWDIDTAHINNLCENRCNQRHIPEVDFPQSLVPIDAFHDLDDNYKDVIIAVPCHALRDVLKQLQKSIPERICLACKGFEPGTQKLNHQVVQDCLGDIPTAILSGPSFATEVARGLPTAVTIASEDSNTAQHFSDLFHSEVFRAYTHDDVVGVEVGGAVKNVMAIAAGIADGLCYGANTRSALITRGLAEIIRLGNAMGACQKTFMGLAGLGDLVLTCTDDQSRNRRLGQLMAKGVTLEAASQEIDQTIEGVRTATEVKILALKYQIEMPITEQVVRVLNQEITPHDAVQVLLAREPKSELQ